MAILSKKNLFVGALQLLTFKSFVNSNHQHQVSFNLRSEGSQFHGKPVGYRGNRPYRRGSVGVTDGFFDKIEPTKLAYSVNRLKISVGPALLVLKTATVVFF
jgi:hypothetical protein